MTRSRVVTVGTFLIAVGASGCAAVQGYVATTVSGVDQGALVVSTVANALIGAGAAAATITRVILGRSGTP